VSIQWQAPHDKQLNGVIRGYQIHYSPSQQANSEDNNDNNRGNDDDITGHPAASRGGICYLPCLKKHIAFISLITPRNIGRFKYFLARSVAK